MHDILILGSEGFIGSNLVTYYLAKKWRVAGIDRADTPTHDYNYHKLLSINDFTEFLLRNEFGYIVNAAGSGNVGFSISHPLGDFQSNCFETAKILDSIRIAGSRAAYLHISSAAVYGNPQKLPVYEEDRLKPLSPYGWHKLMSEMLCREYFEQYGVRSCIIRPFSVFGPGIRKQLFWDIHHKAAINPVLELLGTGNESRDFIYIDDLLQAISCVITGDVFSGEAINVANGTEIFIKDAISVFQKNSLTPFEYRFNGETRSGDPINWRADISRLSALGYIQQTSFEEGIKNYIRWLREEE
jgi:UDP-glucose 4-epimerase